MKTYTKKQATTDHCCELIAKFSKDKSIGINYSYIYREYRLDFLFSSAQQGIYFCPFCGTKLPYNLVDKYSEILEKEFKIDNPYDENQKKRIPDEFESDTWWKKRGF